MENFPFLRALLTWLLFLPVPVINGTLREAWYKAKVGDLWANVFGCLVLSAIFLVYVYASFGKRLAGFPSSRLWLLGGMWLVLTLFFEFGVGLAGGRSWGYMLADYQIWKGRLWPLVLAVVVLSPFIVKKLV